MPRYFTQKITHQELERKILAIWKDHPEKEELISQVKEDPDFIRYESLTPKIEKDLSKVSFSTENRSIGLDGRDYDIPEVIGYQTLSNGLSYLGVCAGGDWECPLFFILYWDGSEIRGYIPTEGNPWNTKTKSAYGNDEEEDPKNAFKRKLIPNNSSKSWEKFIYGIGRAFDAKKITEDIIQRILFKEL